MVKALRLIGAAILLTATGLTSFAITSGQAVQNVVATLAAETTKVIGTVNIAAGQTLGTVTTVTAVTAITNALPAGTNAIGKLAANSGVTIGAVEIAASQTVAVTNAGTFAVQTSPFQNNGVPVKTRVSCTTSDAQAIAANANRVGLEADADLGNTDRLFVKWAENTAIATANTDKRIEAGSSWQPPAVSTVAIRCLSNSGTQVITFIEYSK